MSTNNPITPLTPAQTQAQEQAAAKEGYVMRVLREGDIFLNVLRGGPEDVTMSTSAAVAAQHGNEFGKILSAFLDKFEKDHGALAAASDTEHAQIAENLIDQAEILNQPPDPPAKP